MAPRIQLVLDFDGTITIADTTSVIGSRCLTKARDLTRPDLSEDKAPKSMRHYSDLYRHEHQEWERRHAQPERGRATVHEEVLQLSRSKHIEQASFLRVRNDCLEGSGGMCKMEENEPLRNEFMMESGRLAVRSGEVSIRDPAGLKKLVTKAEAKGCIWGIVSMSWSRRFILGCLLEAGLVKEDRAEDMPGRIRCNELLAPLCYDEEKRPVILCSAQDKQEAFHTLLTDWETQHSACGPSDSSSCKDEKPAITIYVGDSPTDLGCLADSTIGMHMRQDDPNGNDLVQRLKRLDVDCVPVGDLPTVDVPASLVKMRASLRQKDRPTNVIGSIRDFQELNRWIS